MKSQLKHFSKSTISVILSICMLVSCMTVGIIATDAAQSAEERVGASTYYIRSDSYGWDNTTYSLTELGDNIFYYYKSSNLSEEFKIYGNNNWYGTYKNYSNSSVELTASNGNIKVKATASSPYYVVFNSNKGEVWAQTKNPATCLDQYIYIQNDDNATNVYLYLYETEQYSWGNKPDVASSSNTKYTVQEVDSTNHVYKVSGFFNTGNTKLIVSGNSGQKYDKKLISGYLYTTSGVDESAYIEPETTYSVSVVSADTDKGTVAANSVNAGNTTPVTLPTATEKLGYKFKNWTATSPATIASGANSATEGKVTATGTGGIVTANWEEKTDLEFFISGRFRVKASDSATTYENTYDGTGDWVDNCEKQALQLTRSSAYTYTLDTHCTMKELSAQIGGGSYKGDQVFYVHDKTNSKNYFAGSSKTFSSASGDDVTLVTSGGSNSNLKFNSDNENGYVVLSFDPRTMKLSYTLRGAETTCSVTVSAGTGGSTAVSSVTAGSSVKGYLPIVTPDYGYAFAGWTVTSGGNNITIHNPTANDGTAYVNATAAGTVTATYTVIDPELYIVGRFSYRTIEGDDDSWKHTGNDDFDWNTKSQAAPLTRVGNTSEYILNTYASLSELSANATSGSSSLEHCFYIRDERNGGTDGGNYYASAATLLGNNNTGNGYSNAVTLAFKNSALTDTENSRIYFDSESNDIPVTIHFNVSSKKLWYTTPVFYDVTVATAQNGTVTASPTRTIQGNTVTLKVMPDQHYTASVSAIMDGTSNILQLTPTNTGYTFSMPSGNVTVTPTFTPTNYSISYNSKGSSSANATTDFSDATYNVSLTAPSTSGTNNPAFGSYVNGVSVSAPAQQGYTFYKWIATNGTFSKSSDVSESTSQNTTFYPTANGATLKALYRYNYSLSITKPSNGTVSGTTTGYKAGDNYTLTITPNEGYMLDTLTVSNTDVTISANITETGYTYTGTASGTTNPITVAATFKQIEDTVIRVNKYINTHNYNNNSNDHLNGIHIWTRIGQNYYDLTHYPNESDPSYENFTEWGTDPDYPDYYTKSFKVHWGKIQLLFHLNGDAHKTNNSEELATGYQYYIDDLSSNTPVVTRGEPGYSIAGETGLAGGTDSWDTTLVANEMTNTNGTFTLNKTGVAKSKNVPKGDDQTGDYYEYKVVTNHNWNYGSYPANNRTIHVLYDNSNVNFTYTPSTQSLVATVSGGEFKAQTADVAHGTAVISTSSTVTGTDKSVTLTANKLYTEDNHSSGYTTKSVYVKVALDPHYEVTGWTDGNGADLTPANNTPTVTPSSTPDSVGDTVIALFSVDRDITIIPVVARKHHNVTFTNKPTGGTVKVNGQDASPQSVDEFMNYTVAITPDTGYKLKTFKITSASSPATETDYTSLYSDEQKRSAITRAVQMGYYDETVTVEFEKIGYTITGNVSPSGHGSIKYYEDNNGVINLNKELPSPPTATFEQYFWAVYVPNENDDYVLKNFEIAGDGGEIAPVLVEDSFDRQRNRARFKMGDSNATITANIMLQYAVTYYVDMHNTNMKNETVSIAVTDSDGNPVKNAAGENCVAESLGRVASYNDTANVYSCTIDTPFTETVDSYAYIYFTITYSGSKDAENTPIPIKKSLSPEQVKILKDSKEVWLEAKNDTPQSLTYTTSAKNTTVSADNRRIYLAKPVSMNSDTNWTNIRIYYWDDVNGTNNGWDGESLATDHLDCLGNDTDYYYYYVDIPKKDNEGHEFNNIIFQGCGNGQTWSYKAKTADITKVPSSANYYVLSSNYTATRGEDVIIPSCTRYKSAVAMNVGVYDEQGEGSIVSVALTNTPGQVNYTAKNVTYTSDNTDVVTVDQTGKIMPVSSGEAHITIKVYGTIGALLNNNLDCVTLPVTITIKDPSKFDSFEIMSLQSAEYTVNIPKAQNMEQTAEYQPAYFDMTGVVMTVTGIKGVASSTNSAIVVVPELVDDPDPDETVLVGDKYYPTTFTVKYAIPMNEHGFDGYSGIKVTGSVVTKTIAREGSRFGISSTTPWKCYTNSQGDTGTTVDPSPDVSKVIKDSVETATTESIVFNSTYVKYSAIFQEYQYVDVTFVYDYFEYNPKVKDGMIEYPYDPVYAGPEDRNDDGFNKGDYANTHNNVTYTVEKYEVRGINTSTIAENEDLVDAAITALGVGPDNNYYDYHITVDTLDLVANSINTQTFTATVNVHMTHSVKTYNVYLNGELKQRTPNPDDSNDKRTAYYYQEYVELTAPQDHNLWYAVDSQNATDVSNSPLLATGSSYKFRVKGTSVNRDTYLCTTQGSAPDDDYFNRSEVDFSHYETVHQGETLKEYLLQNFYIADFFSPEKFLDQSRPKDGGGYLPYDDVKFVGGGVVYYSVDEQGNPRSNNAVGLGYVNSDGTLNQDAVKGMLKSEILSSVNEDNYGKYSVEENGQTVQKSVSYESLENAIGTEDALKVAYGTEIAAHQYVENNIKTGVLYRYLPLETFSKDSDNWSNGVPVKDEKGNYYTTLNNNTFRYSNTLQSYQYVYASGNENKETNAGKNMRLYSYYVYSYVAYNQETNVPETKYEIVLSDNYSDASTYWNGNTGN